MMTRQDISVIFDLDGTLVDSTADIVAAFNHGLAAVGEPQWSPEAVRPLIGTPLIDMYVRAVPDHDADRAERGCEAYRRFYFDHCADQTLPFHGVVAALDRLAPRILAVATTKKSFMAVKLLEALGLDGRFALIQGTDDFPAKPNPAVLLKVADTLNLAPSHTWMVGDTVHDIQAAQAAGMKVCAVTYGVTARAALAEAKPDLLVNTLLEFVDYLHSDGC